MTLHTGNFSTTSVPAIAADRALWRKWSLAWLGAVALALVNATVREVAYVDAVGERAAHQIASIALILLIGAYVALLERRWPIPTARQALAIGASWAAATVAFEFILGFATGVSLSEIVANYNLADGKLWVLVPLATAFMPAATRKIRLARTDG
jgi:hypothetical protein